MGRKDVRENEVNRYLKDARRKRGEAERILSGTPKDASRGRDEALRAASLIRDAQRLAESAERTADDYRTSAQSRTAADLLAEAQAFKRQFDNTGPILEALHNPHSSSNQKDLKKTLTQKGKEVAADQITNELMTRLAQYATAHTIDGLISVLSALPINSASVQWAGGAVTEGLEYVRGRYRTARSGVDPVTGSCTPARMCHNCRAGRSMNCQNHY